MIRRIEPNEICAKRLSMRCSDILSDIRAGIGCSRPTSDFVNTGISAICMRFCILCWTGAQTHQKHGERPHQLLARLLVAILNCRMGESVIDKQ